jgi:hypothetical protein
LPVAATIIASSRLGLSTWPNSTGAASITMCTPLSLKLGEALVVDGGGDDGLAGQLLQPELVELVHRRHQHRGLAARPCAARSGVHSFIGPARPGRRGGDQSFT